jgi:hypothetical protein
LHGKRRVFEGRKLLLIDQFKPYTNSDKLSDSGNWDLMGRMESLLLQTRVRTLNGELSAIFKRWYPGMDLEVEEMPIAA